MYDGLAMMYVYMLLSWIKERFSRVPVGLDHCLLGSLGVWEVVGSRPVGALNSRIVFHPTRKLVRCSLLKCPSIPNSEICSPRGEV